MKFYTGVVLTGFLLSLLALSIYFLDLPENIVVLILFGSVVGSIMSVIATMKYAQLRGRSAYFGFLGIFGFAIVYFTKQKVVNRVQSISLFHDFELIDVVLIFLVTVGLIAFSHQFIFIQIDGSTAFDKSLFPDQFVISLVILLLALVFSLVKNRRVVAALSAYISLALFFWWLTTISSEELRLDIYILK